MFVREMTVVCRSCSGDGGGARRWWRREEARAARLGVRKGQSWGASRLERDRVGARAGLSVTELGVRVMVCVRRDSRVTRLG